MWILRLNDMRFPKCEMTEVVAVSEDPEKLLKWMEVEKVEPYRDERWGKVFRKGGPLEWYNEPTADQGVINIGDVEDWIEDTVERYNKLINGKFLVE